MKTKTKNQLEELTKLGVVPERLAVLGIGETQIMGEVENLVLNSEVSVLNPKRIIRMQQTMVSKATGDVQIAINFMVGDLDLVAGGIVRVWPNFGYKLSDIEEDSASELMALYLQFYERKRSQRLANVGIALPGGR